MLSQLFSLLLIAYILLTATTGVAFSERTWIVGLLALLNLAWAIYRGKQEEGRRRPVRKGR